jgi:hypothetical protein
MHWLENTRLPEFVTFTGVDAFTQGKDLKEICRAYPTKIEFGILISESRAGKENRYPSPDAIADVLRNTFYNLPFAAHLCGADARSVNRCGATVTNLNGFVRVQVNAADDSYDYCMLEHFKRSRGGKPVIAQCRGEWFPQDMENSPYFGKRQTTEKAKPSDIEFLFDKSGGSGLRPNQWPLHPGNDHFVGYAGGISPKNVVDVLLSIDSKGKYWIDMETSLRNEQDKFDIGCCWSVMEQVYGKP